MKLTIPAAAFIGSLFVAIVVTVAVLAINA